jgi:MATE family multidrug resistance protein
MSPTLVHHGAPASLPSDYAILARYAAAHHNNALYVNEEHSESEDDNFRQLARPRYPRRRSLSPSYIRSNPLPIGTPRGGKSQGIATEFTPLLVVPVIQENLGGADGRGTTMAMFWEELYVLARYTLPVFG